MGALNAPTTADQLTAQYKIIDEQNKRKPGRPKKDTIVGNTEVKESELWREAMLSLMIAQEIKHPKQIETISLLADEYVVVYKEKYK